MLDQHSRSGPEIQQEDSAPAQGAYPIVLQKFVDNSQVFSARVQLRVAGHGKEKGGHPAQENENQGRKGEGLRILIDPQALHQQLDRHERYHKE
jgi:hypothetical protein